MHVILDFQALRQNQNHPDIMLGKFYEVVLFHNGLITYLQCFSNQTFVWVVINFVVSASLQLFRVCCFYLLFCYAVLHLLYHSTTRQLCYALFRPRSVSYHCQLLLLQLLSVELQLGHWPLVTSILDLFA
jgi:hypothetical protein